MNSVAIPASAPSTALSAEADLVRAAARGDAGSLSELVRRHSQPAWRLAQAVAPDRDAAAAAFRDGFVRVLRSFRVPRRPAGAAVVFRPQVLSAVYKAAVDQSYDRSAPPVKTRRSGSNAAVALADAAFRSLPERWRAAVWLSEVESLDVDRIAPILGVSAAVATQLISRGKRGLQGRFAQAHQEVPEHLGEVLRMAAMPAPGDLLEMVRSRWVAAGAERTPIVAPVAAWLEDRAVRPLSVAVGALVGLGLIGLGVVPQGSPVRGQLGASGAGNLAGAVPVQSCYGLPCTSPASSGANHLALGAAGGSGTTNLLGASNGFSPASPGSDFTGSGTGGSNGLTAGSPTSATPGGALSNPATGGGHSPTGTQPGTGTGLGGLIPSLPSLPGLPSIPGIPSGPTTPSTPPPSQTVVPLAPVATVTQTGSALSVNLLPSSSGSSSTGTVTLGCSGLVGLQVGSINLGCTSSAPSTSTSLLPTGTTNTTNTSTSTATAPATTSGSSATSSTTSGLTSTVSGVTSTVSNTLAPVTSTVTNALGSLTSGL